MRFVKPLDEVLLEEVLAKHSRIITLEDGAIMGGFGSAVLEWMAENNKQAQVVRLGIPDRYIEHGSQAQLYKECGYDVDAIVKTANDLVGIKEKVVAG